MTAPVGMEFKTATVAEAPTIPPPPAGPTTTQEGIVTAIIAVTGIRDEVGDVITPGAFKRTLASRKPKVCLGHDWNRPIGKTLDIKELLPGHPDLPKTVADGSPWPAKAGAVIARAQFNLGIPDGLSAFKMAEFYGEDESKFSIGYRVTEGKARHIAGTRHIDDLELFEYGPVLHPAMNLAVLQGIKDAGEAERESTALTATEGKIAYVRNAEYWGMPIGTPITARDRPRGRVALADRKKGKIPSREVGITTKRPDPNTPAPKLTPKKRQAEADAAGLFPEPEAPAGLRVRATKPRGNDELHLRFIIDGFGDGDYKTRDPKALSDDDGESPLDGLLQEGITPTELEEDLRDVEWNPARSTYTEDDVEKFIGDVVAEYGERYSKLAQEQANGRSDDKKTPDAPEAPKPKAPAEDKPETPVVEEPEVTPVAPTKPDDPAVVKPKTTSIAKMSDEELDAYREAQSRAAFLSLNGSPKQKAANTAWKKAGDEQVRRADAARRTVPAHPMPDAEYQAHSDKVNLRRARARGLERRQAAADRANALITQSQEVAAASATDKITGRQPMAKHHVVADGRLVLGNPSTAKWAIKTADGQKIASAADFIDPASPNRSVKLNYAMGASLAARIAAITDAQGNPLPGTSDDSRKWAPGWRDKDGNNFQVAVSKAVKGWADEAGLTVTDRLNQYSEDKPRKVAVPGVPDKDGFYSGESRQFISVGDEVRTPDGVAHKVLAIKVPGKYENDGRGKTVLTFTDGTDLDATYGSFDVKFADDPTEEGYLNDAGMGYTTASDLGAPIEKLPVQAQDRLRSMPDPVAPESRILYTPTPDGIQGEYADLRPRVGRATDQWTNAGGNWFQVVEWDDGTFDGLNLAKMRDEGSVKVDPTPEETAAARIAWGVELPEAEAPAEPDAPEVTGPEAPPAKVNPAAFNVAIAADRVAAGNTADLDTLDGDQLRAIDAELSDRAAGLGKPGQVSTGHQAVKDKLADQTVTPEQVDDSDVNADEVIGLSEGPDGELEVELDVAERQDRVEALLADEEADLTAETDGVITERRRDLVDELRFQDAVARRDRRTGAPPAADSTAPVEPGTADTAPAGSPAPAVPKVRPGITGAAEDLADALESGEDSSAAVTRAEASIRRSRIDSEEVTTLRAAIEGAGGLQAAIDAGTVTPESLRAFSKVLREQRRAAANEAARTRRKVKRLERERLRALLVQYDAEMRRRNLNPDEFGGPVPEAEGVAGPGADRAEALRSQPWRIVSTGEQNETSAAIQQAAASTLGPLAAEYSPVLARATPEEMAAVEAKINQLRPDSPRHEAMTIALLLPAGPERKQFLDKVRTAMGNYSSTLARLEGRARG